MIAPRLPVAPDVRPLSPDDFPALERLFGPNGACGGCWCMFWRVPSLGAGWTAAKGASNRAALKILVEAGRIHGCLAFDGDVPVGWCNMGPREDFAYFERSRTLPRNGAPGTWAVTCFFISSAYRHCGVSKLLLGAAVELARARGAAAIEGYPTIPKIGQKSVPAFVHTGLPGPFRQLGFVQVKIAGARVIMRKAFHTDAVDDLVDTRKCRVPGARRDTRSDNVGR